MSKLRKFAAGQECTLRLPGCTNDTETTVLAHGRGAGMGVKLHDTQAVHACHSCHQLLDSMPTEAFWRVFPNAQRVTLNRVYEAGLL